MGENWFMRLLFFIFFTITAFICSSSQIDKSDIQFVIKLNGVVVDSAVVQVSNKNFISDSQGLVNLKLPPGSYDVIVIKNDIVQMFDVVINEKTSLIVLDIKN